MHDSVHVRDVLDSPFRDFDHFPLLGEHPILIPLVWLLFCFPVAVLIALGRLMGRYALAVERDGAVEIVYPFKTLRLAPVDIALVTSKASHLGYNQGMAIQRPTCCSSAPTTPSPPRSR